MDGRQTVHSLHYAYMFNVVYLSEIKLITFYVFLLKYK